MKDTYDIAVLVGSLRKGSYSGMLADALIRLSPANMTFRKVEIGHLPLYNPDLDGGEGGEAWAAFRDEIRDADGVLFSSPEYNRSVPATIKNALDVGSRPMGSSVWKGKPAMVATCSLGGVGGFGANHHLRQPMVFLDMPVMQQPEVYVGGVKNLFAEDGSITSEATEGFLKSAAESFAAWVAKFA